MRVAYLVNRYPSVSHSFIRREIAALEQRGLEVARFTIRPPELNLPEPADRLEAASTVRVLEQGLWRLLSSVAVVALRHPGRILRAIRCVGGMTPGARGKATRALAYVVEAAWLARAITRKGILHIHAHFGTNSAAVARLTSILSGIPYSFTVHGPEEFDSVNELGIVEKTRDARFVAVISSFGRTQMLRILNPDQWDKIEIIPCGLDFAAAAQPHLIEPRAEPEFDFCFVGRFAPQKGIPTLVEALKELSRRGKRVSLVMIGDGELFEWFSDFRVSAGLEDTITLLGVQGEAMVNAMITASKALLLPSYAEGLPVVLMEALANRRPVISTFVAGIPELVSAECGILVPAGDAHALANAMLNLCSSDAETLQIMGEKGCERVRGRHDIAVSAALLYRRITG